MVRCQDTNFLTINKAVLRELADLLSGAQLNLRLYIETRPEGITPAALELLQRLGVDGIGMGVELASESFRESFLNRFASESKTVTAFQALREAGIKRTAYNMIGVPGEDEGMILDTIRFNALLDPDNITVAFYSPYIGTEEQGRATREAYFDDYEYDVDGQLRTVARSALVSRELLEFYKRHFVRLVREGLDDLDQLKLDEGL